MDYKTDKVEEVVLALLYLNVTGWDARVGSLRLGGDEPIGTFSFTAI